MNHRTRIAAAGFTAMLLAGCAYATTAGNALDTSVSPSPAVVSTPMPTAHTASVTTSPGESQTAPSRPTTPSVSPSSTPTRAASVTTAPTPTPTVVQTSTPAPSVEPTSTPTREASVKPTPVTESGPTGTRWTTSNLNLRQSPDGSILRTVSTGSALTLTGTVQGNWSEVGGGWVATRYLTATEPAPKPVATKNTAAPKAVAPKSAATPTPARTTTAPAESVEGRCARIWAAAQKHITAPAGASLTCGTTSNGQGQSGWKGTSFEDGTYTVSTIWAKLDPALMATATDAQLTGLAAHELAHLRYHAAGRDAQRQAARIMGVTPATWRDGAYKARATERLAQGGAVCSGASSTWAGYTKTSCSTINAALAVL